MVALVAVRSMQSSQSCLHMRIPFINPYVAVRPVVKVNSIPKAYHLNRRLSARSRGRGANLLMLAPPFICQPLAEELVEYYCEVSNAVSLPIILQDPGTAVLTARWLLLP